MSLFGQSVRRSRGGRHWWIWLLVFAVGALFHDVGFSAFGAAEQGGTSADHATGAASPDAEGATHDADAGEAHHTESHEGGHSDPVAPILLGIIVILAMAKVGGDIFERMAMPAVLGELTVGIILGNFALMTGWDGLDFLKAPAADSMGSPYNTGAVIRMLASIGVVLLLFEVGLESTVSQMMSVGVSSFLVAILGVVAPMLLGWGVGLWLIPEQGWQVHAFIGATLCATSVGITARVLKDLGRSQQKESRIILGAAVIDDVLGLIVLAVVAGVIEQSQVAGASGFDLMALVTIVAKAFAFLAGAMFLGTHLITRPLFRLASYLRGHGLLVVTALVICFGFAWLANFVGLAPIVGAFAAGLILEKAQYRELGEREKHELEDVLAPVGALLIPIFFVQMGIQVDLSSFQDPSVWSLAAAITVAAVIGKQVCAFGVREKGLNRFAVGLGMIPRGEVGLIFADVGQKLMNNGKPVIGAGTYSAVVVMVMITTMVTPPLLKWSLQRGGRTERGPSGDAQPPEEES